MFTVLEGNCIGASRQVLLDDSVELVKLVASCWSEPDQPGLLSDFEGHLVIRGIDVHADVIGPGNAIL